MAKSVTRVASVIDVTAAATQSCSLGGAGVMPAIGQPLFVAVQCGHNLGTPPVITAVTDNHGNEYVRIGVNTAVTDGASTGVASLWVCRQIQYTSAGTFTVTVAKTTGSVANIQLIEAAGFGSYGPKHDAGGVVYGLTSWAAVPTQTATTKADALSIAHVVLGDTANNAWSNSSGYTDAGNSPQGGVDLVSASAYNIESATGTPSITWSRSTAAMLFWVGRLDVFVDADAPAIQAAPPLRPRRARIQPRPWDMQGWIPAAGNVEAWAWPWASPATSGAYSMVAGQGSFTLTGQSVNLLLGRKVAADQGGFTLSGQAVTLGKGYPMAAAQGSFTLTGQDVNLLFKRSMPAAQGTYTLTGNATGLYRGYPMAAGQGSFTLAGQDVGLRFGRKLAAAFGSFALAGQSVAFLLSRVIAAGVGSFSLSGQDVALRYGRRLAAAFGSFTLTGNDVALTYGAGDKILSADAGLFTLTGNAAGLRQDRRIVFDSAVFTLTGNAAGTLWGRRMTASHGSFALTGQNAGLYAGRALAAGSGSFALTGFSAGLLQAHLMTVTAGSFEVAGQDVTLIFTPAGLQAGGGLFTLTGFDVNFTHFVPPQGALPAGRPAAGPMRASTAATVRSPGPASTRYAGAPTSRRGPFNTRRR